MERTEVTIIVDPNDTEELFGVTIRRYRVSDGLRDDVEGVLYKLVSANYAIYLYYQGDAYFDVYDAKRIARKYTERWA